MAAATTTTPVLSRRRAVRSASWDLPAGWAVLDVVLPPAAATQPGDRHGGAVVVLSVLGAGGPDPLAAAVGRREEAVLDALDRALVLRCPPLAEDVAVMGEGLRRHGGAYHAFGSGPVPWVAAADLARAARRAVERLEHVGASRRAHDVPAAAALPAADLLRAAVPDAPAPAELVALDPDGLRRCLTELLGDARTAAEVAAFHGWAAGLPGSADSAALVAVLGRDPMPPVDALTAALAGRPDSGRP